MVHARRSIRYEPGNQASLVTACREVAGVIGPHAVAKLMFYNNTRNMRGVGVIFEAALSLKYAEDVDLHIIGGNPDAFLSNFAGMKSLRLEVDDDVFNQLNWRFLRHNYARDLRLLKVTRRSAWTPNVDRAVEGLVRECVALPRLLSGDALELDFTDFRPYFSDAFGLRIIEVSTLRSQTGERHFSAFLVANPI